MSTRTLYAQDTTTVVEKIIPVIMSINTDDDTDSDSVDDDDDNGGDDSGGGDDSPTNPTCTEDLFMEVTADPGNSDLPDPELTVSCNGTVLSVNSNAIPNHETGEFPNSSNPNSISAQDESLTLTLAPEIANEMTDLVVGNLFGVAVNGLLFDPIAAEWYEDDPDSGWNLNALTNDLGFDVNNAHVQPDGTYHYHGIPEKLVELVNPNEGTELTLIGFAADGFPVYVRYGYSDADNANSTVVLLSSSYRVKSGTRPDGPGGEYDGTYVEDYEYVEGLGDLDECNGRFGVTPEYPEGIYHYYFTDDFPAIPRCYVGTPDSSFLETGEGPP